MTNKEAIRLFQSDLEWAKENKYPYIDEYKCEALDMAIEALEEQKTGHWITKRTIMHDGEFYCDVCDNDAPFNKTFHFCPNCGAKMVESEK